MRMAEAPRTTDITPPTEFTWRYNRREDGEGDRVNALLAAAEGRRITYPQLIE